MNTLTTTRTRVTTTPKVMASAVTAIGHVITYLLLAAVIMGFNYLTPAKPIIEQRDGVGIGCSPSMSNNWCAPQNHPAVNSVEADLEAEGLVCSEEATLTDTIIFQYESDFRVKVLTFDEAAAAGKNGLGWTQKFCS